MTTDGTMGDEPGGARTPPAPGRLVISLHDPTASTARDMAEDLGIKLPELVRRGLALVRVWMSLAPGEYLAVRRHDGQLERLVLWPDNGYPHRPNPTDRP